MTLPGASLTVVDGNLGLVESETEVPIVIGTALGGLVGSIYRFSQPKAVVDELLSGPACTAAAHMLDIAGGSVDVLVTAGSTAGTLSAITQIGSGPTVTVAVTGVDALSALQVDDPAGTPVYTDYTTEFGNSTAADVTPFPGTEATGDQFAIGFNQPFNTISVTVSTAGTVGTVTWKFWNGSAWTALSGVTDASTGFTAGTSTYTVTWTMPTTWATRSLNGGDPLYYVVAEVATTYTINPILSAGSISNVGPNDLYQGVIEVVDGGALGTGTYRYSLDNEETWSSTRILPSGTTFEFPGTGVTATFTAGTHVAGTKYTFTAVPRLYTSGDLDVARDAMLAVNDRWKFPLYAGRPATSSSGATLASAIGGHMDDLADDFRLMRALVHTGIDANATVNTSFIAVEDLRLAIFTSTERVTVANPIEGWRNPLLPTVFNAGALAAKFSRGTNIGWVGNGAPPNGGRKPKVTAITFDEFKTGETFHNKKINATRTFVGKSGFYFTNGLLKSPAGSDFRYLHWGLAFDLACMTAIDAVLPYTNQSLDVLLDGSGKIDPVVAAQINKEVNAKLRAAVMTDQIESGGTGFFSAVEYRVDETYDILTNNKFRGDLRCVPKANTEQGAIVAGLTTSLTTAEAA